MKNIILSLMITFAISYANSQVTKKSDLVEMKLNGNVKSIRETSYKAVLVSGEIRKGKRKTETNEEKDSYILFNDKGNQVELNEYTSDGEKYRKYVYQYDDMGFTTDVDAYDAKDNVSAKNKYVNKYDDKGNLIERNHYKSDGNLNNKYKYKYDNIGNLIEYSWFKKDGSPDGKEIFKYDDKGNILEEDTYKPNGNLEWKFTYMYDNAGNCIEENNYKGTKFIIRYIRKFDEKRNQLEIDWCRENGKPYRKYFQKYEYDKNGNWIRQTLIQNDKPTYINERELVYF